MKVTLAYRHEGHGPDETVDLPEADARRLLSDGRARLPVKAARRPATRRPRHDSGTGRVKEN